MSYNELTPFGRLLVRLGSVGWLLMLLLLVVYLVIYLAHGACSGVSDGWNDWKRDFADMREYYPNRKGERQ